MGLFKFTQEQIERRATEVARQHVAEQMAQERAGAARQESDNAAAAPEPRPAKPVTAAEAQALGVPPGDPWLMDLEVREKRAAAANRPQNGQSAAAPGIEPENAPSSTDIATHKDSRGNETLSPAVYAGVQFLAAALSDGKPHRSSVLLAQAAKQGISRDALRRARKAIRVQTERVRDGWMWSLPDE